MSIVIANRVLDFIHVNDKEVTDIIEENDDVARLKSWIVEIGIEEAQTCLGSGWIEVVSDFCNQLNKTEEENQVWGNTS